MNHCLNSYRNLAVLLFYSVLLLASCAPNATEPKSQILQVKPSTNQAAITVGSKITYPQVTVHSGLNGEVWVPLIEAADSLDYVYNWDSSSQTFNMGYHDILYRLKMGSATAQTDRGTTHLPQAPRMVNGKPYLTTAALEKLWGTSVEWNNRQKSIVITPVNDAETAGTKNPAAQSSARIQGHLKDIDENALIEYAHRFIGVPYEFGAEPYEISRRFDCSSYTRHVFKKFGVSLPRTAREQSKLGHRVSMDELQPGDMLFFYVPGRFDTNRIVGHIGIYIGDGKMIHTFGKPGVTIDSIRSGYWRDKFLFAKRIVD